MELSASEAAREVGKSVQTITRAIQSGRLSASGPKGGPYKIEPSELFRVYKRRSQEHSATPSMVGSASDETSNDVRVLELEAKMLREMVAREQDTVADLRARLDAEADERRRLMALLAHHQLDKPAANAEMPQAEVSLPTPRLSWWSWRRSG